MKLPPDAAFHHDLCLMVWRPRGILQDNEVTRIVEFYDKEEGSGEKPFNRFTDLSKLDAIDLDFHFVFRVSLHRRLIYAQRPAVKSAFYVTSPAAVRMAKIRVLLTDQSPLKCAMFKALPAAAKWLGVSKETLEY